MITYRITKYASSKRNPDGSYMDINEWTAISDIGNPKYGSITYEDYEASEDGYVAAVVLLHKRFSASDYVASNVINVWSTADIESYRTSGRLRNLPVDYGIDIQPVKDGFVVSGSRLELYTRLCLREILQMKLTHARMQIEFGYDYYMYVTCPELPKVVIEEIESNAMFVEPNMPRRSFIFLDGNGSE